MGGMIMIRKLIDKIKTKFANDQGYSLIETMAAITVMGVGVMAVALMQISAIQGNAYGMKLSEANALIEDRLETYKNMPYSQIKNNDDGTPVVENNLGKNGQYTRTSSIVENSPIQGVKTITVTVTWREGNRQRSFSYRTIIGS